MARTHMVDEILRSMPRDGAVLEAGIIRGITGAWPDTRMSVEIGGVIINDIRATGDAGDVNDPVWILRSGSTLVAIVGGDGGGGGSEYLNDLLDVAAPSPVDGHVLAWDSASQLWVDVPQGSGGVTDHGDLTGVTPDQHHVRYTDQEARAANTDIYLPLSGGVMAGDINMAQNFLYGLNAPDNPDDATNKAYVDALVDTKMNWRNDWLSAATYEIFDVVTDGSWTMVANKQTTDRPAPQPIGSTEWVLADDPPWQRRTETSIVRMGLRIAIPSGRMGYISRIRFWIDDISPAVEYQWWMVNNITGVVFQGFVFNGDDLTEPGWAEYPRSYPFMGGADETLFLTAIKDAAITTRSAKWQRQPNSQNDPAFFGFWRTNNQGSVIRFNNLDSSSIDQSAILAIVAAGTHITVTDDADPDSWSEWSVSIAEDIGDGWQYGATLIDDGPNGSPPDDALCTAVFDIPSPDPLQFVYEPDGLVLHPYLSSELYLDGVLEDSGDDAYGVDLEFQEFMLSPDWDMLAWSVGGSGGDSGDGFSGSHDDLVDVTPDQHHAELHDLDSHIDVQASTPSDGQRLAWDDLTQRWVPRRSQSALGFVELDYRFDVSNDDTVAPGEIQYDNDDPALAQWMYVHERDRVGNDESLFWDELKTGDWLNLHDPDDVDGRFQQFDVTGIPSKVGDIYHIPITLFAQAGADFNNNFKIRVFIRYIAPPPFSGNHSDLSNVLPDDHHIKYTDQEAIDAVGPHTPPQTYLHVDLTDVLPDQHHVRYSDDEAIEANPPGLHHFVQTDAPAAPNVGTVWVNPDEPPEATYLPLSGGMMTGNIDMQTNEIRNAALAEGTIYTSNLVNAITLSASAGVWELTGAEASLPAGTYLVIAQAYVETSSNDNIIYGLRLRTGGGTTIDDSFATLYGSQKTAGKQTIAMLVTLTTAGTTFQLQSNRDGTGGTNLLRRISFTAIRIG